MDFNAILDSLIPAHDEAKAVTGDCYCEPCSIAYHAEAKKIRDDIRSGVIKIERVS